MAMRLKLFGIPLVIWGMCSCGVISPLSAQQFSGAEWVTVPAGDFIVGSSRLQIEQAYQISAVGYGHDRVRESGWFDHEMPQRRRYLPAFRIQKLPVMQRDYARFVAETGHRVPFVDAATWKSYGLVHPYQRASAYNWVTNTWPVGKKNHPVVLVTANDAEAYAAWLSRKSGRTLRLPTAEEWEKAMRGTDGRLYP